MVDDFVSWLHDEENILLAQLVIPDLRPAVVASDDPLKRSITNRIHLRNPSLEFFERRKSAYDTEAQRLHEEEKQIVHDADCHRACLLLYGRANLDGEQRKEVSQWLAASPKVRKEQIRKQ